MGVTLKGRIAEEAKALGFDAVRFTSADAVDGAGDALDAFGVGSFKHIECSGNIDVKDFVTRR